MKIRKFVDTAAAYVRAGNGGDGSGSFRREAHVPLGGPDGGDGGRGGHVIFEADRSEDSLTRISFSPHLTAGDGAPGAGRQMHGRNGRDLVVKVPCGTTVKNLATGELLADITEHGHRTILARGGKGGLGNVHFKTSTNQAPRHHTPGEAGESFDVLVELKLVAQVALVGFPNAGKSTLLGAITNAHPKIAPYPFTTVNPIIGTMRFPDCTGLTVVDVPGLIAGSHEGKGLGHDFLRHIERCRFFVFVIDMAGTDGRGPAADFKALREELRLHDPELGARPFLVAANKMDCPDAAGNLKEFTRSTGVRPTPISAELREGTDALRERIRKAFSARPGKKASV